MNIGIVGSRRRDTPNDLEIVRAAFLKVYQPGDVIISGGCAKGADRFAEIIAREMNVPIVVHLPKKEDLPEKPKDWDFVKINYARNLLIAIDSGILIACVAPDRKGGTEDTVKKFTKMGKDKLFLV